MSGRAAVDVNGGTAKCSRRAETGIRKEGNGTNGVGSPAGEWAGDGKRERCSYSSLKAGFRFSRKAAMPSF